MRFRFLNAVAALLLVVPGISFALGLGEIQLKSTLNAPLNAEIDLIATDEELVDLKVQLASRDTFTRYGLDYPAFLAGVQVRVARGADGRRVVLLSSTAPITDPFATFLVEASGARGRIQREYTVLFDPPAFAPQRVEAAPPPVAAPVAGGNEGNQISREPAPAPRPATAPVGPSTSVAPPARTAGGSYTVPRGDSLSSIAVNQYGESAARQAMIAIFRANPEAFGGNINQLRAGAVLRLPDSAEVASVDRAEATAEVRRQMAEWSGRLSGDSSGGDAPRLVLVPPTGGGSAAEGGAESAAEPDASSGAGGAGAADNRLQVGGTALAGVQQNAADTPPAPEPAATESPESGDDSASDDSAASTEAQVEPEAAVPVAQDAKPATESEDSGSSFVDLLLSYKLVVGGALVLLLLVMVAVRARRSRAAESDSFAPFVPEPPPSEERDTSADTFPLRRPAQDYERSIVVEENTAPSAPAPRKEAPRTVDLEEAPAATPGIDATGSFEQGDPLAEADFHMAYGLYDQAADLVRLALAREPERRDLKQKLLEVYFVWGNKDQFLQTARDLADSREDAPPGEWEKVVIMGKQLAPEDPLFTQSQGSVGGGSVDLNLEGGQNLVDFDLPSESSTRVPQLGSGGEGDGEMSALDFVLDEPGSGGSETTLSTQQLPTQEMPKPDMGIEGPTVEQPALGLDDTLAGKLGVRREPVGSGDQTAELALDDLGLDLGKLEATGSNLLDDSQVTRALSSSEDAAETLVAGLDDTNRQLLRQSEGSEADATELMPLSDLGGGDTAQVSELDLNFDADSNAVTGTHAASNVDLDLDIGAGELSSEDTFQRTQRLDPASVPDADATQRDLEPVSMSEVGTKLDLARAYMDMGDPDGARSILGEVLSEGSPTQRQEAQRLLDSIPG